MTEQRIGIIDIGSNSIRLVIYERTANGAHRVIDGSKRAARLSEQIDENGNIPAHAVHELSDTLNHFRLICAHHQAGHIRAAATAAIRNAGNRKQVLQQIESETSLRVELLSGEEEAGYGFLGMINSMDVKDGFLIDIGGGSTEVSLFRDRSLVHSVSFPFGSVSATRRFGSKGILENADLRELEAYIQETAAREPWIGQSPGLPLIGVGGTVRAFGKIHQAQLKYSFSSSHNYPIPGQDVDRMFEQLRMLPLNKRRQVAGLSKDRVDIIVPGIAILRTLFKLMQATHYVVCGSGLRDGLFYATRFPDRPRLDNVLSYSVNNLAALHPELPRQHVSQVNRTALLLFDQLRQKHPFPERARLWIDTASTLFRIGTSIDYNDYKKHTFYLMVNSHIYGLSHRETLLCSAIASYKNKGRVKQLVSAYKPLLDETDAATIGMLGTLLQLSIALDRSETQAIGRLETELTESKLLLRAVRAEGSLAVERQEVNSLAAEFKKVWGLTPVLLLPDYR
ncbi:Ppx/GppA phosphatase family protein [Paenibacillus spongiae]|uniref:Ppx/GppA family phosphatase n=1 Tax=Paenibacillus spongiae TaxID=2909671 RepID=A0ABY5SEE6_9BACL|nr:Ppx/GppA phosphatase family protein [Paenibacillus spongiae]UVI31898.1 Ppx/GppA family phosphatase [Paenibacillus spongiae]